MAYRLGEKSFCQWSREHMKTFENSDKILACRINLPLERVSPSIRRNSKIVDSVLCWAWSIGMPLWVQGQPIRHSKFQVSHACSDTLPQKNVFILLSFQILFHSGVRQTACNAVRQMTGDFVCGFQKELERRLQLFPNLRESRETERHAHAAAALSLHWRLTLSSHYLLHTVILPWNRVFYYYT